MLGNSEDHTALSRALSQLAEVEEKIDQLHQDQANADFYLFSELLGDYVRLITAVKVRAPPPKHPKQEVGPEQTELFYRTTCKRSEWTTANKLKV